jgi:hypothetical protein
MPYASKKQERFAHTEAGMKKMGAATVAEFDKASKGKKLPARKGADHTHVDYSDMGLGTEDRVTEEGRHSEHGRDGSHQSKKGRKE